MIMMKNILLVPLSFSVSCFLLLIPESKIFSQKETFDIARYIPPRDWKKGTNNGVITYTTVNATTGGFCVLALYSSSPSLGDAKEDFETEWKERVVTPLKAESNPKTEIQINADGWKTVSGAAAIRIDSLDAYVILTVFSGFGKKFSVVTTLNDQSYISGVDVFLKDIKLDKTPLKTLPVSANKDLSVVGTWSDYSGSLGSYVNSSGVFIHSADTHEMHQYIFNTDKTFAYKELISSNGMVLYTESSGTYGITGDNLTLYIKMYKSGFGTIKEDKTKETTDQYKFYIGPNKWEPGPFLNLHKDGNYYPWSDYPYDYYKKLSDDNKTGIKELPDKNKAPGNETGGLQTDLSLGTTSKFGSLTYHIPKGWNVARYPDGDILTPADLSKGEVLQIWVQPVLNFSGTMDQALQKSYDETAEKIGASKMNDVNGGNYSKLAPKFSFRGWEYIRCSGGIHLGNGQYPPEYGLDLFVIKVNGRFEKISVLKSKKNCNYSSYYSSDRLSYNNDIENFLFSLQFPDWSEPAIKTAKENWEGINGDWQGISLSVGVPKPGAELGAELKGKHLIFFSNGQAFFGDNFPVEGLDEINTWIKAENNRRDWGTYSFTNGRGNLKLPYADIPLRMEAGRLIVTTNKTDHAFIKANGVDGARFSGTYAMSSKDFLGQETGITPLITFTADGKFTDKGALKILNHKNVDCINEANDPGSGTYEIKNYSLIFSYTGGRRIRIAFLGTDYDKNNPSPATLSLSYYENVLRKQ
jgi:hypothetical protein